jgi:hypothetical protein
MVVEFICGEIILDPIPFVSQVINRVYWMIEKKSGFFHRRLIWLLSHQGRTQGGCTGASPSWPCASPPPAWKAGYEKRWGSGQQEKNASLFTCNLLIFCRVSLYIKNSLLIDMDLEKVIDIFVSKNRRLLLWMYVVCQLRMHLQCKYRLLVPSNLFIDWSWLMFNQHY